MKASNPEFQLICEIMDDFISSNRIRCIDCRCIITDSEEGVIYLKCYDPMHYLDGDDE